MEHHPIKTLKLSDLIQRSEPLTATLSLPSNRPISSHPPPNQSPIPPSPPPKTPNLLKTLTHPTILIGTLTLPSFPPTTTTPPSCHCFRFSDSPASSICCDILNFSPKILGQKIKITSFNFIPLKCGNFKGFLEIIDWMLIETETPGDINSKFSNVDSFSMFLNCIIDDDDDRLKGNYLAYGVLESVSPMSVVPCAIRSRGSERDCDSKSVCGFLVKMLICECRYCKCRDMESVLHDLDEMRDVSGHRFDKEMVGYFCGFASGWHVVMTRMIGKVFLLSGLKKKLVYIAKDESQLMYVTTERSFLHLPQVDRCWVGYEKIDARGKGECGCYRGTVTDSYMKGMVIELDREVMLLLTEKQFRVPHSLRVGAIVSIKNVHFVNPRFPWTKVLMLGACFRTSIIVELFSPLETGCYVISHSQSLIEKFVHSLCFCSRLWMLLLITTLRRKFVGIFSEKDILGTRNREGLAQMFASSHIPSSAFRRQNGIFMDFCKHDSCRCGGNTACGLFKLVVPISNLFSHCKVIWKLNFSEKETRYEVLDPKKQHDSLSCGGTTCYLSTKRIIYAEHIGVILVGYLKISSSSGRLQLVDATGEIDVAFSDLPPNWHCNMMIEIKDFNITMEVPSGDWDSKPLRNELFTCQSIFSTSPPLKEMNTSFYLTFTYNNLGFIDPGRPSEVNFKGNSQVFDGGTFHLLWLVHKFPILNMFQGEQVDSNKPSVFAEAIVLPWDLLLAEKNNDARLHVHSCDRLKDTHAYMIPADLKIGRNGNSECVVLKRCKTDRLMSPHGNANSTDANGGGLSSSSLPTYGCSCGRRNSYESRCPFQIPCNITGKNVTKSYTGLLQCRDFKKRTDGSCSMRARKVLLEFNLESFCKYQALGVRNYYILKHCRQDLLSSKEDIKLLITSGMHFWSCSISCPEILQESNSVSAFQSCHSYAKKNGELNKLDTYSDINISIPSYFKNDVKLDSEVWDIFHRPSLLLQEGIETFNCKRGRTPCFSSEMPCHDQVLPEGNLRSLHGIVKAVHDGNESRFPAQAAHPGALPQPVLLQGKHSICIHMVTDNRDVKISGRSYKGAFPAGIGRGVSATFHRILELNGQNDYMLIPASFIEIDSSSSLNKQFGDGNSYTSPEASPFVPHPEILNTESQPLKLHCRVLSVYFLVLEKSRRPTSCDTESFVDIILAGFVLDSGTSSYCCWANHETAAALLKLRVEKCQSKSCKTNASKQSEKKEACGSTIHRLHKILQKYVRIIVKNDGSVHDSLCHDLAISVGSEEIISSSDENILRGLILDSCFSTVQTVVGSFMDGSTTKQLEKYLAEYQMNMPPLQNIWATGVHQINPLSEARNIYQELVGMS